MITWEHFIYFALVALLLWIVGAYAAWRNKEGMAYTTTALGLLAFFSFILLMWMSLERPPLRTMGETRLWYSFFLPFAGLMVYSRWKYKWILTFSTILSLVFICVNLFKPEIHSKTFVLALFLLVFPGGNRDKLWQVTDRLTCSGLAFFTVGMLLGSLWAQDAWGTYWGWDPKETWAAITWFSYLVYIHYRRIPTHHPRLALWVLLVSFVLLQMCWWGINYLPSAQGSSVHTYNS